MKTIALANVCGVLSAEPIAPPLKTRVPVPKELLLPARVIPAAKVVPPE